MKIKLYIAVCCAFGLFNSCKKYDEYYKQVTMRINHFEQATTDFGSPRFVQMFQTLNDIGTNNWTNISQSIEGFDYEPGYYYTIEVITKSGVTSTVTGQNDYSGYTYKLKKINEKTAVGAGTTFEVNLRSNKVNLYTGNSTAGFKILDKFKIDVGTLSNDFNNAVSSSAPNIIGIFVRNADGSYLLKGLKVY